MNVIIVTDSGPSEALRWPGGTGTLEVTGDFDGADVSVEVSPNGGHHWAPVSGPSGDVVASESIVMSVGPLRRDYLFRVNPSGSCNIRFGLAAADPLVTASKRAIRVVTP